MNIQNMKSSLEDDQEEKHFPGGEGLMIQTDNNSKENMFEMPSD